MAPKKTLPRDAFPGTSLFASPRTGEYFENIESLFEHLVASAIPPPSGHKGKDKVFTTDPVLWHEKTAKRIDPSEYSTKLDPCVELVTLFLVPLTPMRSLHALVDTIFLYLQSRFVKNEKVLLCVDGAWTNAVVSGVSVDASISAEDFLDGTRYSPCHFLYNVAILDKEPATNSVEGMILPNVRCSQLRRPYGTYTRAQLRASILQHCKCREPRKSDSIWALKKKTVSYYNLNDLSWWDLFAGSEPRFSVPSRASKNFPRKESSDVDNMGHDRPEKDHHKKSSFGHIRKNQQNDHHASGSKRKLTHGHSSKYESVKKKHKSSSSSDGKKKEKTVLTSAERAERKKAKQQEYKKRWRDKLKKDREKFQAVWAKVLEVREDLECPDLKPIPVVPRVLNTLMPEKFIGDGLFVLEFIRVLGPGLDRACDFADIAGWDLDRLCGALGSNSIDGDFTRLLGFACKSIMASVPKSSASGDAPTRMYSNPWQQQGSHIVTSTFRSTGTAFHNLPISGAAISEVVRLCLLSACIPYRPLGATDSRYHTSTENATLRLLKTQDGTALYRRLLSGSVFALSFAQRLDLLVRLFQAIMEEDRVRQLLDESNAHADENEKALKILKSLSDEIAKLKGKPVPAKSEREPDKPGEKNDRFRQLLDAYARRRTSLRSEKDKTAKEIADDIRLLDDGRKHRRLGEADVASLIEALEDQNNKFTDKCAEERAALHAQLYVEQQCFRLEPIGLDRHSFRYWNIPCVPGLLIERAPGLSESVCVAGCLCETVKASAEEQSSSWWQLRTEADVMLLAKNLLLNGEREVSLKRGIESHMQIIKEHVQHEETSATPKGVVPPSNRAVPVVSSMDAFEEQLKTKLDDDLNGINSRLLATRLGGVPAQEQEAWRLGLSVLPVSKFTSSVFSISSVPSPEISAPASSDDRIPSTHASPVNPLQVDEAAMEPIRLTISRRHLEVAKSEEVEVPSSRASPSQNGDPQDDDNSSDDDNESNTQDGTTSVSSRKKSEEITGQPPLDVQQSDDVRKYANCVTRLVETVKPRFLTAPLVTMDKDYVKDVSQLNIWKISLAASSSLSRLYIHLQAFKKCIIWEKSTVNAVCKACRKRCDSTSLAASCDRCDKTFHLNCLLPALTAQPDEPWTCPLCAPSTVPRNTRRARHAGFSYVDEGTTARPAAPSQRGNENGVAPNSRAARALQRNQNGGFEEYRVSEEGENAGRGMGDNDGRRSGRRGRRRVDYKGLLEGTSRDSVEPADVNGREEDEVYESEMMEDDYDTVSSVESDHSEYDPHDGEKPQWGNKHKKTKRST